MGVKPGLELTKCSHVTSLRVKVSVVSCMALARNTTRNLLHQRYTRVRWKLYSTFTESG